MGETVFYSWQSDVKGAACRTFIETALEAAAAEIRSDKTIAVEPAIDRDTANVPGSPDIGATILAKIEKAAVFVADVTIVGKTRTEKATPNPNVLFELGYAVHALDWGRILLVQNTAFGAPDELPFDLRQKRAITYHSPEDAAERASERKVLQGKLKDALRAIFEAAPAPAPQSEVELTLTHQRDQGDQEIHVYRITPKLTNIGQRRIEDWQLELEFPTPFLDGVHHGLKVEGRSDAKRTLFRWDGRRRGNEKPIFPDEAVQFSIGYYVNTQRFRDLRDLFDEVVRARAFVDGRLVGTVERRFREIQDF